MIRVCLFGGLLALIVIHVGMSFDVKLRRTLGLHYEIRSLTTRPGQ